MRQLTTLTIIEEGEKVLLAMKKRGFGEGWWNGYGGKVEEGETIEEAAKRELEEESGVRAKEIRERGVIEFFFKGTDKIVECHIFEVNDYEGKPIETDEMKPKWFQKEDVPYHEMWPADREWLPLYFEGKNFKGLVDFDGETKELLDFKFEIIEKEIKNEKSEIKAGGEKFE